MVFQKRLDEISFGEEVEPLILSGSFVDLKPEFNKKEFNDNLSKYEDRLTFEKEKIKYDAMLFDLCYTLVCDRYSTEFIFNLIMKNTNTTNVLEEFLYENGVIVSMYDHKTYFDVENLKEKKQIMYKRRKESKQEKIREI